MKFFKKNNIPYFKDFNKFSLGYFLSAFISFLTVAYINKNMTKSEIGEYSYYKSYIDIFYSIITISIFSAYLRFNNNGNNRTCYDLQYLLVNTGCLLAFFIRLSEVFSYC